MLQVQRLKPHATLPTKAHVGDLGYDLYALEPVVVKKDKVTLVRTGIAIRFPSGYGGLIRDRSSIATKQKVFVVAGVIDEGYTGEIKVAFYNPGLDDHRGETHDVYFPAEQGDVFFDMGAKIAQLILVPVTNFIVQEVESLGETTRGAQGFGSSDVIRNPTG